MSDERFPEGARLSAEQIEAQSDLVFYEAVGRHIGRQIGGRDGGSVMVLPSARKSGGWLEWLLHYSYTSGGGITVGAIQRSVGAEVEFHS